MGDYAAIRNKCRKGYADGGRARSDKTTVNVIVPGAGSPGRTPPSGGASGAQVPPPAAAAGPGGPPPRPVPPVAGNAALGAMGGQPMMKRGGKVKQPAGAGGGLGRLQKSRNKG